MDTKTVASLGRYILLATLILSVTSIGISIITQYPVAEYRQPDPVPSRYVLVGNEQLLFDTASGKLYRLDLEGIKKEQEGFQGLFSGSLSGKPWVRVSYVETKPR